MGGVFVLFGLPFVLIGFFILASPLFAAVGARETVFAVTNLRALTISAGSGKKITSYYGKEISVIESTRNAAGFCDVKFTYRKDSDGDVVPDGIFMGIKDAAACERSLRALLHRKDAIV